LSDPGEIDVTEDRLIGADEDEVVLLVEDVDEDPCKAASSGSVLGSLPFEPLAPAAW
jgi:hypothetical protein